MNLIYAKEPLPSQVTRTVFLAGPTPRHYGVESWRGEALDLLRARGFSGTVFIPEDRSGKFQGDYQDQVEWEESALSAADVILFWVPRTPITMPGFTTNVEWGAWCQSGKVVLGSPEGALSTRYLHYYADKLRIPSAKTLSETVDHALRMVPEDHPREGAEVQVPAFVWKSRSFQGWYQAQRRAGNRLDGAKLLWTFFTNKVVPRQTIFWALHVDVHVASEGRNKVNEIVISRPDISSVVMYRRRIPLEDSDIILVREFRSPASNDTGFVWENAGGSSWKPGENPNEVAVHEVEEETGLRVDPSRIRQHGCRQLMATMSAHQAHLFSVEITDEELAWLRAEAGVAHGVEEDSERTYVEVGKVRDLGSSRHIDWSTVGMILSVLTLESP